MYTEYDSEGNYTQEEEKKDDRRKLYLIIIIVLLLLFFGWLFFFSGWIKFGYDSRVKSISISMKTLGLKPKDTYQLYAEVNPKNAKNKTVKWQSSDSNIVEVDEKTGMVTAIAVGEAIVTVISNDNPKVSADCLVTVSDNLVDVTGIAFTSDEITIYKGSGELLEVVVSPEDAKTPILKFSSSNNNIVKVNDIGYVTGVAVGSATVMVQTEDGKFSDTIKVNVKSGGEGSGGSTIINPTGLKFGADSIDIVVNTTQNLAVTFIPSNATNTALLWASTDTSVVKVENGAVTGLKVGKAQVKATTVNNITATIDVNVIPASIKVTGLTVEPTSVTLKKGGTKQITAKVQPDNASNKEVTYTSSDTKIATVSENGLIKAIAKGTATITVKTKDQGKTATVKVTVTEESAGGSSGGTSGSSSDFDISVSGPTEIVKDTNVKYSISIKGTQASLSDYPRCTSSNTNYVTTLNAGGSVSAWGCIAYGKAVGTAKITFTATNTKGVTKTKTITIKVVDGSKPIAINSIRLSVAPSSLKVGQIGIYEAVFSPLDADTENVIWKSSDTSVATITSSSKSGKGVYKATITAKKAGTTYISAQVTDKYGKMVYDSKELSVWADKDTVQPTCGKTVNEPAVGNWTKNDRVIGVYCIDNEGGTGCTQNYFEKKFSTSAYTGSIRITDKAGNYRDCPVSVYVDKTAPTCSISTPAGYDTSKTITVKGTDTFSGVKNTKIGTSSGTTVASQTYSSTGTFVGTVTDKAGNQKQCSLTLKSKTQYSIRSCNSCKRCEYAGVDSKKCIKYSTTASMNFYTSSNQSTTQTSYKYICNKVTSGSYAGYYHCYRYPCTAYQTTYKVSCPKCGCASWSAWGSWTDKFYSSTATTGVRTRKVYYQG